jgi:NodT family efflux transporter outer membrane factor (OMF) lipoprotein
MSRPLTIVSFITITCLAGCLHAPSKPELHLSNGAEFGIATPTITQNAPEALPDHDWWIGFGTQIDAWRNAALRHSPSLALARAKLALAQVMQAAEAANTGVEVALNASTTGQLYTKFGPLPPVLAGSTRASGRIALDASKNLDFFDATALKIQAAGLRKQAAALGEETAALELTIAIVQEAITIGVQREVEGFMALRLARSEEGLKLVEQRIKAGLIAGDNRTRAQTEVARSHLLIAAAQGARKAAAARLQVLTGLPENAFFDAPLPAQVRPLIREIPADLLARRVDVAVARLQVDALSAGERAAAANFYPNINLTGFVGLSAIGLPRLLRTDAGIAGITPALHLPIFERAQLKAAHRRASAELLIAAASYDLTVQNAVRQVAELIQQAQALETQSKASNEMLAQAKLELRAAEIRFGRGLSNRIPVITAMGSVLDAETVVMSLTDARWRARLSLVSALGGGLDGNPEKKRNGN